MGGDLIKNNIKILNQQNKRDVVSKIGANTFQATKHYYIVFRLFIVEYS